MALVQMGQVGGTTLAVGTMVRYVYFGLGPRLVIADNTDPAKPRTLGATEPLGDIVRDVIIVDGRAVVAVGRAGVAVVDVTDPTHPRVVSIMDTPGFAWSVAASGRLYVADGPGGLRVAEIAGGRAREVGAIELGTHAFRVAARGDYAYVMIDAPELFADGFSSGPLQVVDARQPGHPRLVDLGSDSAPRCSVVAVHGDRLFTAQSMGRPELTVFDISEPGKPTPIGALDEALSYPIVNDISVDGSGVALAGGSGHPVDGWVARIDVSDPAHPSLGSQTNLSSRGVRSVALDGPRMVASLPEGGFVTLEPAERWPYDRRVGALEAGFEPMSSAVAGGRVYSAAGTAGLAVVDVRRPYAPRLEGRYLGRGGGAVTDYGYIALSPPPSPDTPPRHAYITSQHGDVVSTALRAFDLTGPDGPREVGVVWEGSERYGEIALGEGHAFVVGDRRSWSTERSSLRVFDVTTTVTPTLVATMGMNVPVDVALRDGYAYVADARYGFRALDVQDPSRPYQTDGLVAFGQPSGVSATDRHLVAVSEVTTKGANHGHLEVYDRSDPAHPRSVGSVDLPEAAVAVAAVDDWACVTFQGGDGLGSPWNQSDPAGVYLIDLSDPSHPRIADRLALPGAGAGVTVADDLVYVSMDTGGLHVLAAATYRRIPLYLPALMPAEP